MIGGAPLMPIPTTRILGSVSTAQIGLGTIAGLAGAAKTIAGTVGSLAAVVQNPVASVLDAAHANINSLTADNFSSLDTSLDHVATNPALADSYSKLKNAMGGGDGTSGLASELSKFKDHTDRISGVTLGSDNDLNKPLTIPDTPGGR